MRKKAIRVFLFATVVLFPAQVLALPIIFAPWKCGTSQNITQGYNGSTSHGGVYAVDIGMSKGTDIIAPAPGTIMLVKEDSDITCKSGCDEYMNYVIMSFDEGGGAAFYHLMQWGAEVSVGQHVNRGDLIGRSGNTGNVTGPHLHFQVQEVCGGWYCNTISTPWYGYDGDITDYIYNLVNCDKEKNEKNKCNYIPEAGYTIVSNNCCTTEICDGIDNDCDGEVDEGNVCCTPTTEVCDGKDNNCNDAVDEGSVCEIDDDAMYQTANYGVQNTDIDGDGKADICARGAAGLYCTFSSTGSLTTVKNVLALASADGWGNVSNSSTLQFGDVNGDGKADVCVRSNTSLKCWLSKGTSFGEATKVISMASTDGYNQPEYYSTIRLGDIDADGSDELCVRLKDGYHCYDYRNNGWVSAGTITSMSDKLSWNKPEYYSTIRMGDVNGDGKVDVCARGVAGVYCWLSEGNQFSSSILMNTWSDANEWNKPRYYQTIRMADVNGDHKADICARSSKELRCELSDGKTFSKRVEGPALSDAQGWGDYTNYSTFRTGDINGDGKDDLCIRADTHFSCYPSTGNGFGKSISIYDMSDGNGWNKPEYYRTIRLGDVDGDGKADVCARSSEGMVCYLSTGTGFKKVKGPEWSDNVSWNAKQFYTTVRVGGPIAKPCSFQIEQCDEKDNNCNGQIDEGNVCVTPIECVPEDEKCDGIDNDCDDEIDEDGVCDIKPECVPEEEYCDGQDNDCDGAVDEDDVCQNEQDCTAEETCDGEDNDCDGEIDEDGVCDIEVECIPSDEICDGIDNDCDSEIDEDGVCDIEVKCIPSEEICDGEDNDCDGEVDEDGVCDVEPECIPSEEICDGKDNDCDGEIDEGCDEPGNDPAVDPDDSETQIAADDDCGCRVSSNAPTPSGLSLLMGLLAGIGLFGLRRRKEN